MLVEVEDSDGGSAELKTSMPSGVAVPKAFSMSNGERLFGRYKGQYSNFIENSFLNFAIIKL